MTKFVAYYNLCPIDDPKEFLGISPDRTEGNVITTLNKNIIIIIKISSQKQIKSWSVTEKLTTKVVYDKQSQLYIGVFANRTIRCWDEACEDVNKCKKLKFKKSIADLVMTDEKVYVLYADGSCELLAQAIESRKEETNEQNTVLPLTNAGIFDAKIFKLANGLEYLTYFQREPESKQIQLVVSLLQNGRGTNSRRFKLDRSNFELKPTGYAVVESNDALVLLSIWSDNSIYTLKIDDTVEPEKVRSKFAANMSVLRADNEMSVVGVSRNFVAIYGANGSQEGASLLLYNTKFHVIKSKQYFKVYLDFSRLWTVGQYILLAMGRNLSVVTYNQTPDLLADLLGTQVSNNFDKQIILPSEELYEEEEMQSHIHFAENNETAAMTNLDTVTSESEAMSTEFADGQKIPYESVDGFNEALSELGRLEMSTKIVEVENALEDVHITLMSNYCDSGFVTPEIQLITEQMEKCGASECEITEKLLTLLMKANLLADIVICFRRYSSISEKMLVKVLNYALKIYQQKDKETKSEEIPPAICQILNAVFACHFDSESIALHLRREIDYESVVILMKYLYDVLENADEAQFPTHPVFQGSINDGIQLEMQILKWFSTLLSSHFQKLCLSKDTKLVELLFKWHVVCYSYKSQLEDLQATAELLYKIVDKKELTKEISSKWYTIEEVCLW